MGNACINFKRKKRFQEEELNFRRKMEERIQQSSKRLKNIPAEQINQFINNGNNLSKLKKTKSNSLNKSNVTPLRLNSDGVFVEIDQQFIDEQLNNLKILARQNMISNPNLSAINRLDNKWTEQLLDEQNNVCNLSRMNKLRLLEHNPVRLMNSYENKSFVNTSIDSGLFNTSIQSGLLMVNQLDQYYHPVHSRLNNSLNKPLNNQLINQQFHPSLPSINAYKPELSSIMINNNQIDQFNSSLLLHNVDQKDYLNRSQIDQSPACTSILDSAADRIFSELEYMDNQFNYDGSNLDKSLCYLPLDGFMRLNKSKIFNCTNRFSNNFDTIQLTNSNQQNSHLINLNSTTKQISNFNNQQDNQTNLNKTESFNSSYSKSAYSIHHDTVDHSGNHKIKTSLDQIPSLSLNNENIHLPSNSDLNMSHNLNIASSKGNTSNVKSSSNKDDQNNKIKEENAKNYLTLNLRKESIEEERKDELNDSGNGSGIGCTSGDKQISRTESIENHLINSQIELEPWFFIHISSRIAAEHVLRMKGNRVGAFLVRHSQKNKFKTDAPFVLSLKVVETSLSTDKQQIDKSFFDKSLFNKHPHYLQSNHHNNATNEHLKVTKDILHYKIYSQSACSNCDLIMYYINPAAQFTTIRQLILFYSETENCGLPIKLDKPCLPFDFLNCCYSANVSLASANVGLDKTKPNCDICDELMFKSRSNRWSTGNLSNTGTQPTSQQSAPNSLGSNETFFQTYIEHNPNAFVRLAKDELKNDTMTTQLNDNNSTSQKLSKSLNSVRVNSVDRISNNGIPVNSTNRILTDIKFNNQINLLNRTNSHHIRFSSSLDDFGLNNSSSNSNSVLNNRLKDRFRNHSLASINFSDHHNLTNSGSSLSRKSSDSRKSGVLTGSLIGGHKYRINSSSSSCSFKENIFKSADNLKRRSSSIRLKPGSSGRYQLRKVISCSVNNVSSLKST